MKDTRSFALAALAGKMLAVVLLIAGTAVFAAEDTYIDATFKSQDGHALGSISTDPSIASMDTIFYCPDDLPIEVMIHGQRVSGAGAEYADVQLLIDGVAVADTSLDMPGLAYVNLDVPDISDTPGDGHAVTAKLIADANYNAAEVSGYLKVVDCEGSEEEGPGMKFFPFKWKKEPRFIDDDPYIFVPLQEAIDVIRLTRDKIDELNRNAQLKADMRIALPEPLVKAMVRIINENPELLEEMK